MAVMVEKDATWIKEYDNFYIDEDIEKIFLFFTVFTPVKKASVRSKTLLYYGWENPWSKDYHLNLQLKNISVNKELIYSADSYDNLEMALEKSDLLNEFPYNISLERVAIHNNMKNQFISIFYHIRNSIAHGRFEIVYIPNINERVICMEDVVPTSKPNGKLSARMIIYVKTLLNWIELIQSGPRPYR